MHRYPSTIFTPVLFLALTLTLSHAQSLPDSRTREIVIHSVNIVPMDGPDHVLSNQTVVIKGGKIVAIGNKPKYGREAFLIDGAGQYLIPGLGEMHAHVPPTDDLEPMKEVLFLFASHGITTIRGMLGHPKHLELRDMLRKGEIAGPAFFTTGPSFNGISVTSAEAGAAMVRKQKEDGYDFLKLHPGLSREKFDAIAKTAKEVNIPFVGHVSFGVGVWHAIESGYSTIDHLDGFVEGLVPDLGPMMEQQTGLFGMFVADKADASRIPKLTAGLKEHNIRIVPTQSLAERWFSPAFTPERFLQDPDIRYMKPETIRQWTDSKKTLLENPKYDTAKINNFIRLRRNIIRQCHDAGVVLLLGCDAPQVFNVPGISTHDELLYITRAGISPYEALKTGTVNVAEYLGTQTGRIAPGAVADLVLIGGNPLKDITQTRNIQGVMLHGQWWSKEYIQQGLKKIEEKYAK